MDFDSLLLRDVALKTQLPPHQILSVLKLIFEEECTVPFIVRYRKERTGGLDEIQVRQVHDEYESCLEREKRRHFILETLKKQEVLTPELERLVQSATTLTQLEEIYAPFKSKRKTKAQTAREKGLEPLALLLLQSSLSLKDIEAQKASEFVPGPLNDIASFADALEMSLDIIVEKFVHHTETRDFLRKAYWEEAQIISSKKEDAEQVKDFQKYQDFFEYKENVKALRSPKSSHRFFALRRGQKLKVLKVEMDERPAYAFSLLEQAFFPPGTNPRDARILELLHKCAHRAYQNYIHPALETEIRGELKILADSAAIDVFGKNLKNLLLSPYLGSKTVMGVDPGVRTGCKIVVIDSTGKLVEDQVVFPFAPKNDVDGSRKVLEIIIRHYDVSYVAIGNGTNGRETYAFFKENVEQVKNGEVKVTMISESGASIYSASDIAREEFPDKDPTVRGAVSIARRFQDPLAELVKIDPKSIGVGQYQHDVNQSQLKKSLGDVVESCVNYVGVDINTASAPLLAYISGMNKSLGQNVVKYREETGGFHSRDQLLKIPRFTPKIFQQCAGFLRIYGGKNPLDATFIHPEQYPHLQDWAKKKNCSLKQLVEDAALAEELKQDNELQEKIGELTLLDIAASLRAPSQDPRKIFESLEFPQDLKNLEDVKTGQMVKGVVTNITNFGAFIDIGIKEQGLVHISELSHSFVENTFDHLEIGQEILGRVLSVDLERRRLGLSLKSDKKEEKVHEPAPRKKQEKRPERVERPDRSRDRGEMKERPRPQEKDRDRDKGQNQKRPRAPREMANRPFSVLKNLKIPPS